jgi:hypothetical protein
MQPRYSNDSRLAASQKWRFSRDSSGQLEEFSIERFFTQRQRNDIAALGKACVRSGSPQFSHVRLLLKSFALKPKKLSGPTCPIKGIYLIG